MFYKEFLYWIKNQNFNNKIFKKNKDFLFQKLEYLRLIYLLHNKKIRVNSRHFKIPQYLIKVKINTNFHFTKICIKI